MIKDFFSQYFVYPLYNEVSYNFFNTLIYAVIGIAALYMLNILFNKLKIKINFQFFLSLVPFIFLGSTLRALVDSDLLVYSFWTVTPGIYIAITALFLAIYIPSFFLQKDKAWKKTALVGAGFSLITWILYLPKLTFINFSGLILFIIIFSASVGALYFIFRYLNLKYFLNKLSFSCFFAHMFDASTTFIIVDFFGGWEKHPLPRLLAQKTGTAFMQFPLKLMVLIPAVYLIQKEISNKNLKNILLIGIAALGLSQGLRNLISLLI